MNKILKSSEQENMKNRINYDIDILVLIKAIHGK